LEQRSATPRAEVTDRYVAFWSDNQLRDRAQYLGAVAAGDALSASIVRARAGWQLQLTDHASHRTYSRELAGPTDGADQVEWLEEDPSSGQSARRSALAALTSIIFNNLFVNGVVPRLASSEQRWMSTVGAGPVGPRVLGPDTFAIAPVALSDLQAQFLSAYGSLYLAAGALPSARIAREPAPPAPVVRRDLKLLVMSLFRFDESLQDHAWPKSAQPVVSQLLTADVREMGAARALVGSGRAQRDAGVARFDVAQRGQSLAVEDALAALGIPATLPGMHATYMSP
jgi:hypothetical protein